MSQIQEYDLEIKPSKIINGQGLEKIITEGNQQSIELGKKEQVNIIKGENDKWYLDIIYYLKKLMCPKHLVYHKRTTLILKSMKYCLTREGLGWRNSDGVILICVNKEEANKLISELHSRYCGGHFIARTTTHKISRAGYYCPTIFFNTHRYARSCQPCQYFSGKQRLSALPLNPVVVEEPFQQWGFYFICEFKEKSNNGY